MSVCGSSTIRNPDCSYGPLYDWKRDVTQREEIYISGQVADSQSRRKRAVNTSMEVEYTNFTVYVTVEGLDTNNTFFLNTTFGDTRGTVCVCIRCMMNNICYRECGRNSIDAPVCVPYFYAHDIPNT